MSEMVERVARAFFDCLDPMAKQEYSEGRIPTWDELPEGIREECRVRARAAIEAMREPTQVMLAWSNPPPWDKDALEVGYREVWEGMIDTALKDEAEDQS